MKKTILLALLILCGFFALNNCVACDDCFGIAAPKSLKIVNGNGDNLVFGQSAVYNPDIISIKNNLGETIEFSENFNSGTLDFGFSVDADTYFIKLTSTDTDTLVFTYTKDKHIDCCNEFDVTKTTNLNGKIISNDDEIIHVK